MKKILVIIIVILLAKSIICQTLTYNKLYTPYPNNSINTFNASSIINEGSHYFFVGYGNDTINSNFQSLIFCKIDSLGDVSRKFTLTKTGWNYYPEAQTLIKCKNGGFLYLGQKDTLNYNPEHILIRFDDNLDTIWTKTIHNYNAEWEAFGQVKETSDKGLIFVGAIELSVNNLGVLLVKTDSLGNQIWRKTYNLPDRSGASRIIEMPDRGFLLKGFHDTQITGNGGPFLIKTDSLGNQQWYKDIGGNQYDGSAAIALTNDSNILVAYGYSTYSSPQNDYWRAQLNIIKYKLNGTQIWSKFYDSIYLNLDISKIQILYDNCFIVMGIKLANSNTDFDKSFLFKFNNNGDSLWSKNYYLCISDIDNNYLYDNVLNSDKGITACGAVIGHQLTVPQQIWLLKTDSNGYAPGPQNISVSEHSISNLSIKIFPNPATDFINIILPEFYGKCQVEIYSNLGQLVYSEEKKSSTNKLHINTMKFHNGIYKIVVKEKEEIRGQASFLITN
ncbi:MAG: T9SS type A sorting domain-containing protein [Bacteroidetes bacterium]|nr:T9SS type A sorting domain-containing protein [Bacteroidota bacterium]